MFTTAEIAEKLNVSPRTVRNWIDSGQLAGYRFGKDYRVEPSDLEQFIQRQKVSPFPNPNYTPEKAD